MPDVQYFLRFRLGFEWYGIEVGALIEVLHFVALSELPASRPDILGMMRLRDAVAPVLDLRVRFGLAATYSLTTPIVVADTPAGPVGLVVDDVDDLVMVDQAAIAPQAEGVTPFVSGVARLEDGLLLVLNPALLRDEIPAPSQA